MLSIEISSSLTCRLARPPSSKKAIIAFVTLFVLLTTLHLPDPHFRPPLKVNAEVTQQEQNFQTSQSHPSLLVDVKYWIRNTELSQRDNWSDNRKPCSLLERIKLIEQSVVTLGDSFDSLSGFIESNINLLSLAQNGAVLLEEDSMSPESLDPTFIEYLNQTGDCFEQSQTVIDPKEKESSATDINEQPDSVEFEFTPPSDHMSWFNPNNWASSINEPELLELAPESHRIPCGEDVVVFGDRHHTLGSEGGSLIERSEQRTFKVNFRNSQPSEVLAGNSTWNPHVKSIRVAKLRIGNEYYDQLDFERLVKSEDYENILFQFEDELSVIKGNFEESSINSKHISDFFIVDDAPSIKTVEQEYNLCSDEAGCLCGNEDPNIMQVVCSFNQPIEPNHLPCNDPISSTGYCNKICATVMTIVMDPSKFSERYLTSTLQNLLPNDDERARIFAEHIFVGTRRTDHDKYEITFILVPTAGSDYSYSNIVGRDYELAQLLQGQLNRDGVKSFYGVRSIRIRSSKKWRKNNRFALFWLFFTTLLLIEMAIMYAGDKRRTDMGEFFSLKEL